MTSWLRARWLLFAVVGVVVVLLATAGMQAFATSEQLIQAEFASATRLHAGDPVRVLGVEVGEVKKVEPRQDGVMVTMSYRLDSPLAREARAVITAPSLVPVRAVELGPVAKAGEAEFDPQTPIPRERTATPIEWDEIKSEVTRLAEVLGPNASNADGALNRLLRAGNRNVKGRGSTISTTMQSMAQALATLDEGRDDLFATVTNLDIFINALADADEQVAAFNNQLATTADVLGDNTKALSKALAGMDRSFEKLTQFIRSQRPGLNSLIDELAPVVEVLAESRREVADLLQIAPTSMSNIYNIYEPIDGSIAGAFVLGTQMLAPAQWLCGSIIGVGGAPELCATLLGPLISMTSGQLPFGISAVERNGRSNQVDMRPGARGKPGGR